VVPTTTLPRTPTLARVARVRAERSARPSAATPGSALWVTVPARRSVRSAPRSEDRRVRRCPRLGNWIRRDQRRLSRPDRTTPTTPETITADDQRPVRATARAVIGPSEQAWSGKWVGFGKNFRITPSGSRQNAEPPMQVCNHIRIMLSSISLAVHVDQAHAAVGGICQGWIDRMWFEYAPPKVSRVRYPRSSAARRLYFSFRHLLPGRSG
jgi:hypothetical protein